MKAKCKNCGYCRQLGRQQTQRGRVGRKHYYCEHPEAKLLPLNTFGNKATLFIGFGEHTLESPLSIKTSPRWCPINNINS
ncbi:hypothetical protein ACP3VS_22780 [Lysinibacillus sp. VIII_CA]|uniref:hypothetical protein n=1 Tax=Lysinibacillus TaxID=400634 RepID=UPI0018CF8136|nr:hypothetical protein [Lysinibacillus sphaericus]MBG9692538.1 hypothetical protein [Lysinibacillus sphaericus]